MVSDFALKKKKSFKMCILTLQMHCILAAMRGAVLHKPGILATRTYKRLTKPWYILFLIVEIKYGAFPPKPSGGPCRQGRLFSRPLCIFSPPHNGEPVPRLRSSSGSGRDSLSHLVRPTVLKLLHRFHFKPLHCMV